MLLQGRPAGPVHLMIVEVRASSVPSARTSRTREQGAGRETIVQQHVKESARHAGPVPCTIASSSRPRRVSACSRRISAAASSIAAPRRRPPRDQPGRCARRPACPDASSSGTRASLRRPSAGRTPATGQSPRPSPREPDDEVSSQRDVRQGLARARDDGRIALGVVGATHHMQRAVAPRLQADVQEGRDSLAGGAHGVEGSSVTSGGSIERA